MSDAKAKKPIPAKAKFLLSQKPPWIIGALLALVAGMFTYMMESINETAVIEEKITLLRHENGKDVYRTTITNLSRDIVVSRLFFRFTTDDHSQFLEAPVVLLKAPMTISDESPFFNDSEFNFRVPFLQPQWIFYVDTFVNVGAKPVLFVSGEQAVDSTEIESFRVSDPSLETYLIRYELELVMLILAGAAIMCFVFFLIVLKNEQ